MGGTFLDKDALKSLGLWRGVPKQFLDLVNIYGFIITFLGQ